MKYWVGGTVTITHVATIGYKPFNTRLAPNWIKIVLTGIVSAHPRVYPDYFAGFHFGIVSLPPDLSFTTFFRATAIDS